MTEMKNLGNIFSVIKPYDFSLRATLFYYVSKITFCMVSKFAYTSYFKMGNGHNSLKISIFGYTVGTFCQ